MLKKCSDKDYEETYPYIIDFRIYLSGTPPSGSGADCSAEKAEEDKGAHY